MSAQQLSLVEDWRIEPPACYDKVVEIMQTLRQNCDEEIDEWGWE